MTEEDLLHKNLKAKEMKRKIDNIAEICNQVRAGVLDAPRKVRRRSTRKQVRRSTSSRSRKKQEKKPVVVAKKIVKPRSEKISRRAITQTTATRVTCLNYAVWRHLSEGSKDIDDYIPPCGILINAKSHHRKGNSTSAPKTLNEITFSSSPRNKGWEQRKQEATNTFHQLLSEVQVDPVTSEGITIGPETANIYINALKINSEKFEQS